MKLTRGEMGALSYVEKTNGGATIENFYEDHDPIGHRLWVALVNHDLVMFDENRKVRLTDKGKAVLKGGSL